MANDHPTAAITVAPLALRELANASSLCLRSKAHWGYDAGFIDACREELSLKPTDLQNSKVMVA
ncbi:MAG: hypothetical protein AAGE86_13220, partial [Pseudomonadota bacterium]